VKDFMKKFLIILMLLLSGSCSSEPPEPWPKTLEGVMKPSAKCDEGGGSGTTLSKVAYFLITPIITQVQAISQLIFNNIVENEVYRRIITVFLTLYMIIYGIMFMFGMVKATVSDLIIRLIKISLLVVLSSKGAYAFFNDYLFKLFTNGSGSLLAIVTNPYCKNASAGSINFFSFFNYVTDSIFDKDFAIKLTALLFAFPIGWLCFVVLIQVVLKYLAAVLKAIIAYLFAFTAIGLLISLGPIFIALILFERTRSLFDNWMKAIIGFSLQPVLLFASIFFVSIFINEALQNVLGPVVWSPVLKLYLNLGFLGKLDLGFFYWYRPSFMVTSLDLNTGANTLQDQFSAFLDFAASLVTLYLCVDILGKLPEFVEGIGKELLGGGAGVAYEGAKSAVNEGSEQVKGLVGQDKKSSERRKKAEETSGKKDDSDE
jgi:type IV secretory pathway VirB6-like protein